MCMYVCHHGGWGGGGGEEEALYEQLPAHNCTSAIIVNTLYQLFQPETNR